MGNKVNPIGLRLQINRTWDSRWFANAKDYGALLHEDLRIREFIKKTCANAGISRVVIERPHRKCRVTIYTARPISGRTFENDIFGDEDRDYTNGVRLDYVTPRNNLSAAGRLAKRGLYGWFSDASDWYGLYTLGQNIYTPSDISLKTPPKTDRPYAGFLYLGAGVAADRGDRLDTIALEVAAGRGAVDGGGDLQSPQGGLRHGGGGRCVGSVGWSRRQRFASGRWGPHARRYR